MKKYDANEITAFRHENEKALYGKRAKILSESENCTVYRIAERDGDVIMTAYRVFDGIYLIYNDIHAQSCGIEQGEVGRILNINHCAEGRIECELRDEYVYLEPGDMSISCQEDAGHDSFFPTKHYHGITIAIDPDCAPDSLSCFLEDVDVCPAALIEKFCAGGTCFVARSAEYIEHIFSELYSVRDCIREGYFKIKVLELLLFLSGMDTGSLSMGKRGYTPSQVALAKKTSQFISTHLSDRMTIEQLSSFFHVSATQLKNCFKGVYGVSVYAYIRSQKMHAASQMLKTTDYNVLDIANRFGYDNGSKFAKAFRAVMGMTPNEFRNALSERE